MRAPNLSRMKLTLLSALLAGSLSAADLTLLDGGNSNYRIVVPGKLETPALTDCLAQTARLLQGAIKANWAEVPVVREAERDASKPALLLAPLAVLTSSNKLKLNGAQQVRDIWRQKDLEKLSDGFTADIPRNGVMLIRSSRAK